MTREEAIVIIENEKECVNRANKNDYCNRDCYNCELVKTDTEILTALDMAIEALEQKPCEDCISRQAAKLKVARVTWDDGDSRYDFHDKCVDCLDDLPSVTPHYTDAEIQKMQELEQAEIQKAYKLGKKEQQKMRRWIPCEEKLPEYKIEVLTCSDGGFIEIQSLEDGYWENQNGDWSDIDEVVAWMPLPEPYKEVEDV